MTGQPVIVLLISLMLADLAYSIPKLERRPAQKDKRGKKWMRQGITASVGGPELLKIFLTMPPDLTVENDAGLDDHNNNQYVEENLSQNPNYGSQENTQYTIGPYVGQEDMDIEGNDDYGNDNIGVGDEQDGEVYYENDGELGDVTDAGNNNYDDYDDKETENRETRALQAGDIFTAQEMLPIAEKLMKKVNSKGVGKGIISSAFHPKVLADTLFARFFLSMRRIVVLEEIDIPGLDALQALALSGEVAELRSSAISITESSANQRGEHLLEENPIRKSHYKLLRKRVDGNRKLRNQKRRHRVNLANKLRKNRKVVVNPGRRGIVKKIKVTKHNTKILRLSNKPNNRIRNRGNIKRKPTSRGRYNKVKPKSKNTCRWIYECTDKSNLDTCRLHTDCSEQAKNDGKYIGVKLNDDEHTDQLKQFRRAIGIDVIDEEVEKILENRYLALRPQKSDRKVEKVESLAEYFNNILMHEELDRTYVSPHPMAAGDEQTKRSDIATEAYNESDHAAEVLQAKRRILPGILKTTT